MGRQDSCHKRATSPPNVRVLRSEQSLSLRPPSLSPCLSVLVCLSIPSQLTMSAQPVVTALAPIKFPVEEGKEYYFCACGRSKNAPLCDGSHEGTGIQPIQYIAKATEDVYPCQCKRSSTMPFCDGTHRKLAEDLKKKEQCQKLIKFAAIGAGVAAIAFYLIRSAKKQ